MHIIKPLLCGFKVSDFACEGYVGFRVVYLRHSGTQVFSRFRSKPGFKGDESYCYAPAVISVSICPSVFSFMSHPNNTRKFFFHVSYAGSSRPRVCMCFIVCIKQSLEITRAFTFEVTVHELACRMIYISFSFVHTEHNHVFCII